MKSGLSIVILTVFWVLPGSSIVAAAPEARQTIVVEDANGTQVAVGLPVKRLVVLTSDALEVIRSLGASDFVAGVYSGISKNGLFWPQLNDKPKVGSWKEINYEQVLELNPDAVLCYGSRPGRDMEKKLAPFGIQVIRLDFYKPATLIKEVLILGRILGKEREAADLAAWYGDHMNHIRRFIEKMTARPKVYIEGNSNYHTAAPGAGGHDMCVSSGGNNIAGALSIPYPEVTSEWIVTANPDVVVNVTTKSAGGSCYSMADARSYESIRAGILNRPAWSYTNAVKSGRVHVIANDIWTGPRAVVGMYYLVKWFFPDTSPNFHPDQMHKQYLERFQKIPYQGVYVYPE